MLRDKFNRHTIAFIGIALASIFLYPAAQVGTDIHIWTFLVLIQLAAIITLSTK